MLPTLVALAAASSPPSARAASYLLGAEKDAWISEASPVQNHGTDTELYSKQELLADERPMLQFDLSAIPAGSAVKQATLGLFVTQADSSRPIDVHRVTSPWNEASVVWLSHGHQYDPSTRWGSFVAAPAGPVTVDVTALVQLWLDGKKGGNQGLTLASTAIGTKSHFASREWAVGGEQPWLYILTDLPTARVATGTYVGDGSTSRSITGLGFAPDLVLVKGDHGLQATARSSTMPAGLSKPLGTSDALVSSRVVSLDANGFTIDADSEVNEPGTDFHWTAFREGTGPPFAVGTYTGDGLDDRSIAAGFQPGYVIVMGASNEQAMQRFGSQGLNSSLEFKSGSELSDRIQRFEAAGFQVGSNISVNEIDEEFHWAAWAAMPGQLAEGTYTGDGTDDRFIPAGFQPDWAMVRIRTNADGSVHRPSTLAGDATLPIYPGGSFADGIQALAPGGFEVGTDSAVNRSGVDLFFVAARDSVATAPADLHVAKVVDLAAPNEGDTVGYTVTLQNLGPGDASGVVVADSLPAGVTWIGDSPTQGVYDFAGGLWTVGDVAAGDSATLWVSATVDPGTGGTTIVNGASIAASSSLDPSSGNDADSAAIDVQSADLGVVKTSNRSTASENSSVTFTVWLHNYGPDSATSVVVADTLPSQVTFVGAVLSQGTYDDASGLWDLGALAAGDSASLRITVQVDPGTAGQVVTNTALLAGADQADPNAANDSDSASFNVLFIVTLDVANLSVIKTVDIPTPDEGATLHFAVNLTNSGPQDATGVEVTDVLPAGLTYLADSTSAGSYDSGTGTWTIGDVFAPSTETLDLWATVDAGTAGATLSNVALVTATEQDDTNPANNADTASVRVLAADLSLAKTVDVALPKEGDTVHFTVCVRNEGPDSAAGVEVTDSVPPGLTWTGDTPSQGTYDSGTGVWVVGAVAVGDSATLDLACSVDAGAAGSSIQNVAAVTASLRGDPDGSDDAAAAMLYVPAVDLAVTKVVDAPAANEGDAVVFTIGVANAGPDSASAVLVADLLPVGLTHQSDSATHGIYAPGAGQWDLGSLAAGDSATLSITATVDPGTGGTTLWNAAALAALDQTDVAAANDADSVSVSVRLADLAVAKTVDDPNAQENATVVFGIVVTNAGPDSAAGIQILDALPAGVTYVSHVVTLGSWNPLSGAWTLGTLAASDSATLTVTATVDPGTAGSTLVNVASVATSDVADHQPANDSASASIVVPAGITVFASQSTAVANPGDADVHLLTFSVANSHPFPVTLDAVSPANVTAGPGTVAERDAELGTLTLWQDDGDLVFEPAADSPLASATAAGGSIPFAPLSFALPSGALASFHVAADLALTARDGDTLDLQLSGPASVAFVEAVNHLSTWPLAPAGAVTVDGAVAAQITASALADSTLAAGSSGAVVFAAVVPANGYAADVLQAFRIENQGTAVAGTDVAALRLWVDGGDGAPDLGAGDDAAVAALVGLGSAWTASALSVPVPPGGARLFVSADLAADATHASTIRLRLPAAPVALTVASANDGPMDAAVVCPALFTIQGAPSDITVSAAQTGATLLPGAAALEVLRLIVSNEGAEAETLSTLTLTNMTTGPGTQSERDGEWSPLQLAVLKGGIGVGVGGLRAGFSNGTVTFAMNTVIAAAESVTVVVTSGASLSARDGDMLDLAVADSTDFVFTRPVSLVRTWPLAPAGAFPVDGMSVAQVGVSGTALPINLLTGSTNNPSLAVTIPANGYAADTLRTLNVKNLGTAAAGSDIERVDLWLDVDGDAIPEPGGADAAGRLGPMVFTGDRWEITGLAVPVPAAGRPVFVTTDIAAQATVGSSVTLVIPGSPDLGAFMASTNDGPLDGDAPAATARQTQLVSTSDRIVLTTSAVAPGTVAPGQTDVVLLWVRAKNDYTVSKTITGITVTNGTAGSGTQANLDAQMGTLRLRTSTPTAPPIAQAIFASGRAPFGSFALTLAPGETRALFVTADLSLALASDGDALGASVAGSPDVTFSTPTTVVAGWPLDSGAAWTVDGMLATQIANHGAPPLTLGPSEGPALALDVTLPSNGYAADVLRGVTVVNDSTATAADVAAMRLYRDGGDNFFDAGAGDDVDLGPMSPLAGAWTSPALAEPLGQNGARCFVAVTSSASLTDGRTVRLAIPVGGVNVESGNDGPTDARIANTNTMTLSTAALLATLDLAPNASTIGSPVTATLLVRNAGDSSIVGITPSALIADSAGVLAPAGGPVPSSFSLAAGDSAAFTWTWTAAAAGIVRLTGSVSGTELGTGLPRQSLDATSDAHQVFVEAQDIELFPTESMPFSISRGQTGVVPLSLTFTNNVGGGGSDVEITRVRFRLVDGTGAGIVPADLLARVVVNEGTNAYATVTSLPAAGDSVDLLLSPFPKVAAAAGQVTLSLSLDISDTTTVPDFRLQIPGSAWFEARDATSGAPVAVLLAPTESFPIESGLARVVAEATELDVSAVPGPPVIAGRGQTDVPLLYVGFLNPDPDSLAADVRVSSFEVTLVDSLGAAIASPAQYLQRIRVLAPFQVLLADRQITASDDSTIALVLSPLLSVPMNNPLVVSLRADIAAAAPLVTVRLALADAQSFDARDANTGAVVPVIYAQTQVLGPPVMLVQPADSVAVSAVRRLPPTLPVGTADVAAAGIVVRHPGGGTVGPVAVQSMTLECRDGSDSPLLPAAYLDQVRVLRRGAQVGLVSNLPGSGGSFTVVLSGPQVAPGQADTLEVRLDLEVTAPATLFRLALPQTGLVVTDASLGLPVSVVADSLASFPLSSGVTQIVSPARQLVVGFEDRMPPVLAGGGSAVSFAALSFTNPAAPTAGPIFLDSLAVRAADGAGLPLDLGDAAVRLEAWEGDSLRASSGDLVAGDALGTLHLSPSLALPPGVTRDLELRAAYRAGTAVTSLRLGLEAQDVGPAQPSSSLLAIAVLARDGQSFPFWTEAGNFSGATLEESWSNFPNPFAAGRDHTTFAFFLVQPAKVTLKLWTARGDAVRTLVEGRALPAGLHQNLAWDGRNGRGDTVLNGIYLAELSVDYDDGASARAVRKVAVVR
ncbi:MAG: DNRLRE domain-containing protein [Candidatus Eiseniibacteriota bacterium]